MKSTNLSVEEKLTFMMVMQSSDKDNMLDNLAKLSDNTLELIFKEFTINNQKISSKRSIEIFTNG